MRLKSVELIGFKSFARKTQINFFNGITEIVGPNGSGKSNIIEAIRWALGEQSAKNLRSSRMTDVIFSGSQSHPALNRAKVTLAFDNHDHLIRSKYDDLTISRTVYRDGTNNYYINSQPCRLRDVQDLFMNTGIGDGSFSIISQGKVSQIFKSKPVDRRFIIETVAGIYKYRSQKVIADKKLTKVHNNLNRLHDLNYDLKDRLLDLKQARRKALNYLRLKKTADRLDRKRLLVRNQRLIQSGSKVAKNNKNFQVNLKETNTEIRYLKRQHLKLQNQVNRSGQIYDQYQDKILRASHRLDKLSGQQSLNRQKISFWRRQIKSDKESISKSDRVLDRLNRQLFKLNSMTKEDTRQVKTLTRQNRRLQVPEKDSVFRKKQNQIQRLRSIYLGLVKKSVAVDGQLANFRRNSQKRKVQSKRANDHQLKIRNLKSGIDKQIKDLDQRLNRLKRWIVDKKISLKKLSHQSSRLNQAFRRQRKNYQVKAREKQTLLIRLNGLRRMTANHSNLGYGSRNLLNNADRFTGIQGPVAKFIKVPDRYVRAIETTLRSQLQQIIVDTSNTAKQAVQFMTRRRLGRVTLLPVNDISKRWVDRSNLMKCNRCPGFIGVASSLVRMPESFSVIKEHLLGNVLVARDVSSAILVSQTVHRRYRVVTLDGNVVNAGGAITGGHGRYQYHGLLSQKAKADRYRVKLNQLNRESQESSLTDLRDRLNQHQEALNRERSRFNRSRQKYLVKLNLEKRLVNEANNYQQLLDDQKKTSNPGQTRDRDRSEDDLLTSQSKIKDQMAQNQRRLKALQHRVDQITKANTQSIRKRQQLREALIKDTARRKQDLLKKASITNEIKRTTQSVDHYHRLNFRYRKLINQQRFNPLHRQEFKRVQIKINKLREQKLTHQRSIKRNRNQTVRLGNRLSGFQDRALAVRNQINQNQLKIDDLKRKRKEVHETLLRRYRMDLTRYSGSIHISLYQVSSRLLEIQKRLRKMGPVDVNSITKFKKVNHRYQFLSKQINDLIISKRQLVTTMNQMNSKIVSKFKTTFDQVNRAFKSVYSQIFRGGKAKLTLLDPHHLLTTGINIMAQPPGKRYRNMELLSGGERALTAIALLFAILRVKPAPFCILDEAESALDAINIDRFGDYMQKLKNKTQFIVITHRKTTMLYADNLYGVTMQNSGISKIISVNLRKAKE